MQKTCWKAERSRPLRLTAGLFHKGLGEPKATYRHRRALAFPRGKEGLPLGAQEKQGQGADADRLETLTDKSYWPYPTYSDLLFYV